MQNNIPLCVDLDGTVITLDTVLIGVVLFAKRNPLNLVKVLYWLCHGKPSMKEKLFKQVMPDPKEIPYNTEFLVWLRHQKKQGRKLYLVTGTNQQVAVTIANHLELFDGVMASTETLNLKALNKSQALNARFGVKGYDYVGNSDADFVVWASARNAIVVNPTTGVEKGIAKIKNLAHFFPKVILRHPVKTLFRITRVV